MTTSSSTILVVDDEQSYRDALAVALEREGFRVEYSRGPAPQPEGEAPSNHVIG